MVDTRDHPIIVLGVHCVQRTNPYNLRPGSSRPFNKFVRTKKSENFFTFKYSSFLKFNIYKCEILSDHEILSWFNVSHNTLINLSPEKILMQKYTPGSINDNLIRQLQLLILLI